MSALHSAKYASWESKASALDAELQASDEAEKAAASAALGHDGAWSEEQSKEMQKAEQAKLAKAALDKQKLLEESAKLVVTSEMLASDPVLTDARLRGKRILVFKNLTGGRCRVAQPEVSAALIKVFVEGCADFELELAVPLLTSHVELHKCTNVALTVERQVATVQLDQSGGCAVRFGEGAFEGPDDRVYSAGCGDLTLGVAHSSGARHEITVDYLRDGAVPVNECGAEEYQFVARWSKETGGIVNEPLMRVGNKFLTKSTVENASLSGAARLAIREQKAAEAEQHKLEGNDAFGGGEYAQAVLFYSMALDKVSASDPPPPLRHVCLSNRAACFLKLGHPEKALKDAGECAGLEPGYAKGWFRKGLALHAMGRYEEALPALAAAQKIEPGNKQVKQALQFAEAKLGQEMRKRMQGSNA
ncbi:hypothetical protein TeGR_g7452 [Tetraparma gracilis]|uniref:Uncharacterized protein n=1 Tax=Tetraparma gracilis TaxID=2962635 RepID=A0ABQ6M9Y8_9STRA|nr:hypothetical protein TeGR_g7452 [Tetraparma gracilis]